jgi:hypothetical protein
MKNLNHKIKFQMLITFSIILFLVISFILIKIYHSHYDVYLISSLLITVVFIYLLFININQIIKPKKS